jgi:hypothetical protein
VATSAVVQLIRYGAGRFHAESAVPGTGGDDLGCGNRDRRGGYTRRYRSRGWQRDLFSVDPGVVTDRVGWPSPLLSIRWQAPVPECVALD